MIVKKRKGDADIVVIPFFIMFMVLFFSYYHFNLFYHPTIDAYQRASVTFDFYDVKNSLEAAEIYLDSAHTFSLYQALYENFKHGGYNPIDVQASGTSILVGDQYYALWYDNGDLPSRSWTDIMEDINILLKQKLDNYLVIDEYKYLGIYRVEIPDKEKFIVNLQRVSDTLELTSYTESDSKLELQGNHEVYGKINLKKAFSLERTYNIKTEALYEKAKEHLEKAKIELQEAKTALETVTDKDKIKEELDKIKTGKIDNGNYVIEPISDGNYEITYTVIYDENINSDLNFAIKVEVVDASQQFPVSKLVENKPYVFQTPLFFRFYLVNGQITELPADEDDTTIPEAIMNIETDLSNAALKSCKVDSSKCLTYAQYITSASKKHGVDVNLVAAVVNKESTWGVNIVSTAGAVGLMQLMPCTAKGLGLKVPDKEYTTNSEGYCVNKNDDPNYCKDRGDALDVGTKCDTINDERFDDERNIDAGVGYLKERLEAYKNYPTEDKIKFALASYNGGPTVVNKAIRAVKDVKGDDYLPTWDDIKDLKNPEDKEGDPFISQKQTRPYAETVWEWYMDYIS